MIGKTLSETPANYDEAKKNKPQKHYRINFMILAEKINWRFWNYLEKCALPAILQNTSLKKLCTQWEMNYF